MLMKWGPLNWTRAARLTVPVAAKLLSDLDRMDDIAARSALEAKIETWGDALHSEFGQDAPGKLQDSYLSWSDANSEVHEERQRAFKLRANSVRSLKRRIHYTFVVIRGLDDGLEYLLDMDERIDRWRSHLPAP